VVDTISPEQVEHDQDGIRFHYDLPAEFFRLFLGDTFNYSSGYYRSPDDSLDQAQQNKIELYCKKLELGPNDHLLDIGAGWGNLMFYVAQKYGCKVTGLSLSPVQKEYITKRAAELGISHLINYELVHALAADFPDGTFTKAGSLEATEHIEDLPALYRKLYKMVADDGIICVQIITGRANLGETNFPGEEEATDFMRRYIYPVGRWANISEAVTAMENAGFEIVDLENITDHYYLTQQQWYQGLQKAYADKAASTGVEPDRYLAQLLFAAGSVDTFSRSTNLDYQLLARKNGPGIRRPLQLDRATLTLDGPERKTGGPYKMEGQVQLSITGDVEPGQAGIPSSVWHVDMENLEAGVQEGPATNPVCKVSIDGNDLLATLTGQLSWPDAFVQGKLVHEGDLTAVLWVRDALRSPLGGF
jgi:cyclopropane-fatty-acyl-phospholipid synthase